MIRHSRSSRLPTPLRISQVGTRPPWRFDLSDVAMVLILTSLVAAVCLTLAGAGAARLDLALARWVFFYALSVVIGSAWRVSRVKRRHFGLAARSPIPFPGGEAAKLLISQEYALAALLGSGAYVLVGYAVHFAGRFGPWHNGYIGMQGLLLLLLATVGFVGNVESRSRGQGFPKLVISLSILCLVFAAGLDLIPYLRG